VNEEMGWIRTAIDLIEGRKGENIVVVDLTDVSIPTSYFVIAEADNAVHLKAIASELMKSYPLPSRHREGWDERRWVVMDFGDLVVHLFQKDARAFYDIESLWADHVVPLDSIPSAA
jgi:ribosome-associated protein